ncbi:MAG: hypothetical protein ACLGID_00455 [Gammaproteobacteria bacterium]
MSEQTANLCTTDACESLRQRLAKYEDAEGRPLRALLLPERKPVEPLDFNRTTSDVKAMAHNACLDEVALLNSSPVSSGDPEKCSYQDDPRSPAELSLAGCNCVRFGEGNPHWPCKLHTPVSACGVDELAAFEAWYLGHFYMGDKQCGLEWLSTEPCGGYRHQHPAEQWIVWQARAALSAPSHGEQVRGCFDANHARALLEDAMGLVVDQATFEQCRDGGSHVSKIALLLNELDAMLAAATPSAGSQEQG